MYFILLNLFIFILEYIHVRVSCINHYLVEWTIRYIRVFVFYYASWFYRKNGKINVIFIVVEKCLFIWLASAYFVIAMCGCIWAAQRKCDF